MKDKAKAVANIVITMVLFLNAVLTASGRNPLPIDQDAISVTISEIVSAISIVWCWWKNQNITTEASAAQKILDQMKYMKDVPEGTGDPEDLEEGDE